MRRTTFLISLLLCLAVLLTQPSMLSGQKLPLLDSKKGAGATSPEKVALPETDEEIDKSITWLESRLADLRGQPEASAETTTADKGGLFVGTPEELRKRERLMSELMITLDKHEQILRDLKELRKLRRDHSAEMQAWKGFTEKPPFPISFLDGLRDSLLTQKLDSQTLEVKLTVAKGDLQQFTRN
jgi:hypothetical protein